MSNYQLIKVFDSNFIKEEFYNLICNELENDRKESILLSVRKEWFTDEKEKEFYNWLIENDVKEGETILLYYN